MRRPLVAGNWKLNGSRTANAALVAAVRAALPRARGYDVMVCPPFVYLTEVRELLSDSGVLLGAQNAAVEQSGAYTGEVSAVMLRDVGCSHVIVGHSERRTHYGESDAVVAHKFMAVRAAGLTPVLCVGETLQERNAGVTEAVIRRQLGAVFGNATDAELAGSVIAYEPVWAIGTGHTATPAQAQEVHVLIRGMVAARDARIAKELRILYGGSVKGSNARDLFAMPDIDGGLVGGASLDAAEFALICTAAAGSMS
jgi:triosephosphate isomerase